jgi:hypothetical protein
MDPLVQRVARRYTVKQAVDRILLGFGVNDFKKLNQAGRQFAVLSGYRAELPKHQNQQRHGDLVADLQRLGYRKFEVLRSSWVDQATGVRHGERSVIVPGMGFRDATDLMSKYKQDAIIYKDPSDTIGIYSQDHSAIMAFEPDSKDLAVLQSTGREEYSRGRSFSFGLQLVEQPFHWDNGPVTKAELMAQMTS